jgi:glycerol-3-phosphate dehydrogenase
VWLCCYLEPRSLNVLSLGQHNDARMNISLIMTAVQHGATVANHTEVIQLHKNPETRLSGARVRDRLTGEEFNIRAKVFPLPLGLYLVCLCG